MSSMQQLVESATQAVPAPNGDGPVFCSVHDAVGTYLWVGPEAKEIFGVPSDDLVGESRRRR